jgi:hypothetical protein
VKVENIVTCKLDFEIEFDGHKVKKIKFDLEHINRGWDKDRHDYNAKRRSHYAVEDIVDFFEQFGFYAIEWEENVNKNKVNVLGETRTRYFAYVFDHNKGEKKKMIIDIPENFVHEGIIITLY